MTLSAKVVCSGLILAAGLALSGCVQTAQSQLDEEKEAHFLAGKSRIGTMDYKGAVESFEKALEANPHSAAAHFELACLFEQKEADPAAAIYHYDQYLHLRPKADNADLAKQHITFCKQELAKTVSLGPVTEKVQRDLEQLTEENKRLVEENKRLHDELDKAQAAATSSARTTASAAAARLAEAAPGVTAFGSVARPAGSTAGATRNYPTRAGVGVESGVTTAARRTHTVKAGETPSLIARKYGVKLETLMAANPKVDARRLQVGQTLAIPAGG